MGRPRIGKRAMTPAERQRRRRLHLREGVTSNLLRNEQRARDAFDVIVAHLDSLEDTNDVQFVWRGGWYERLLKLLKREVARLTGRHKTTAQKHHDLAKPA